MTKHTRSQRIYSESSTKAWRAKMMLAIAVVTLTGGIYSLGRKFYVDHKVSQTLKKASSIVKKTGRDIKAAYLNHKKEKKARKPFKKMCWSILGRKSRCKVHTIRLDNLKQVPSELFTCIKERPGAKYSICESRAPFAGKRCFFAHNTLSCYGGLSCSGSQCEYTTACQMKKVGFLRRRHLQCNRLSTSIRNPTFADVLKLLRQRN